MADTVLGQQPLEGGLRLMRLTAAIPVGAVLGGIACQRLDYRVPTMAGLGFGLLIAPIALAATNSVNVAYRGTAAALITAMRMVGMTIGLAALTAWGTDRFQGLVAVIPLPFSSTGETAEQARLRAQEFDAQLSEAGLTLFNDFFLVAMGVCLFAVLTASLMAWRRGTANP